MLKLEECMYISFFMSWIKNNRADAAGSVTEGRMYDSPGLRNYFMADLC